MQLSSKNVGITGEARVAQWLSKKGYAIITCNFRKPFGEIDIIAQQGEYFVFVEVKARSKAYFDVSEVVTKSKQRRIIRAANAYLMEHGYEDCVYRFDVAIIENIDEDSIVYLPNAFTDDAP